jgi:hypothetical protein
MRRPQRHRFRRLWLTSSALVLAAGLAAADETPRLRAAAMDRPATDGPSTFDFMVLASMADSPHLLAMAGYRPAPRQCAAHPADRRLPQCRL